MSHQQTAATENVTFEGGYEELKGIVARLGSDDVSVHEMFESFRRGKGLEKALRGYLQEREGELTEIEQGHNLPQFNIVAAHQQDATADEPAHTDEDIPF
jgi:exodeoxyribonuclease VII small subunit